MSFMVKINKWIPWSSWRQWRQWRSDDWRMVVVAYYPNPDIETRIRVQTLGAYSKSKKHQVTFSVMRCFLSSYQGIVL